MRRVQLGFKAAVDSEGDGGATRNSLSGGACQDGGRDPKKVPEAKKRCNGVVWSFFYAYLKEKKRKMMAEL